MAETQVILLVEDNPDDEALALRAMRKNHVGTEVVVVRDGAECLDYLLGTTGGAATHPLPQLVLLDLNLPKLGGLEVLGRLRADARTKLLPIVILTSSKQEEDIVASYTRGANAYVRKPIDFAAFSEAIRAVGAFWLAVNEPIPGLRAS